MQVDINLLPQREKRTKNIYIILGIIFVLLFAAFLFVYLTVEKKNTELLQIEKRITQTNEILEAQQAKLAEYQSSNAAEELKIAIEWAEKQPFELVFLMEQITRLLPERGFVIEFELDEENRVKQIVQFDAKSEAAYFLHSLTELPWIEEAIISEAKTADILKDEAAELRKQANIQPRYYAEFELRINPALLNEAAEMDESKGTEEKVSSSQQGEGADSP
ncbi:fimbrial assembly protein [Cytobacillus oceanisediminis]|uniref:PilN domain-containing protein n=1 Tax=Cytobacillus oceanisediminis TaxID=665099 RepID=UPI001D1336B9|nr:fimbrial assembly protein [Cytobacillus oceanisediminis]MCC3647501.1 fimbrial assembly protein [Cytobacillus oceanisediminis]